eukprot:CAMPEP_0194070788 /NCGR_PEP_ID=MMETSP0009_2-20130614/88363_1 /TAXON_ID=210454 /ORGANISM="Grammatophora oceanica, Strain CCMP 410" /LENGTH=415 /DNA_ID=CAMNT_0038724075 /DNA_START=164 /DNA_END=1408 /DNA_ORIENTATION=+
MMDRFGWAFSYLLAAILSFSTVDSFHINGKLFQNMKEEHNAFVKSMLSPASSPHQAPMLQATTTRTSTMEAQKDRATRSSLFPCVPCMVTSFYSYMDSFSVSTKLMATTTNGSGDSSLEPSQARKLLRALTLAVWKAVTLPMTMMYNLVNKLLLANRNKAQPKPEKTITDEKKEAEVVISVNGDARPAAAEAAVVAPYAAASVAASATTATMETGVATAKEPVLVAAAPAPPSSPASKPRAYPLPKGDRWAVAAPNVDLSGDWAMIVSEEFKREYDDYLKQLGQPQIVRTIAVGIIGLTTEYTEQSEDGRKMFIRGTNARGVWERVLLSSGSDPTSEDYEVAAVPIITADDEKVFAESWWENKGRVHVSWMRGVEKYGGGDFEAKRFLEQNGKVLVCESTFHPTEEGREPAKVIW